MTVGIIGYGSVGKFLARRLKAAGISVVVYDHKFKRGSAQDVINLSDIVFFCVRPQNMRDLLKRIEPKKKIYITAAAAIPSAAYYRLWGKVSLVRIMPALGGRAPLYYTLGARLSRVQRSSIRSLLKRIGPIKEIKEEELEAYGYLTSCAPAIAAELLTRYADAVAIQSGLAQKDARKTIAEALGVALDRTGDIATKGGITEAGLTAIRAHKKIFAKVVNAMTRRTARMKKL